MGNSGTDGWPPPFLSCSSASSFSSPPSTDPSVTGGFVPFGLMMSGLRETASIVPGKLLPPVTRLARGGGQESASTVRAAAAAASAPPCRHSGAPAALLALAEADDVSSHCNVPNRTNHIGRSMVLLRDVAFAAQLLVGGVHRNAFVLGH